MNGQDHDRITLHRLRFPAPIAAQTRSFPTVQGASVWQYCPQQGADRLSTLCSDMRGGPGIWTSRVETIAAGHCLAVPVSHRGKETWRDHVEDGTAIRPAAAEPGGSLVVVTTAGFLSRDDKKLPGIRLFVEGVAEVIARYAAQPGNLRADAFNGADGRGGVTGTLWRSDKAMREAAHRDGRHRARKEQNRARPMFDHASFTHLRAQYSQGGWRGDPFTDLQQGAMT